MKSLSLLAIVMLVLSAGCRQTEPVTVELTEEDIQTIQSREQEYEEASLSGNIDDMLALRTDSTIVIPPGEQAVKGKENLREYYQALPVQLVEYELAPVQTSGTGDLAYNRGNYNLATVVGQDTVRETGKYVQVWEQIDGVWLMSLEIWNTGESSQQLDIE